MSNENQTPLLGVQHDIYGLSFRLLAIADDDREDDWLRDVCRQSGEMMANLANVVTTDHESKADFVARVRAIIAMQNVTKTELSAGEYDAVWSGHEIRILGDWNIATENGVRGRVSGRVIVTESGGIAFLPNDHDEGHPAASQSIL